MITGFIIFLLIFTIIGISSVLKSRNTKEDYYLARSAVSPWLVGLSAVATNNSGYMFIGVIGYTYATGLASVWLMTGWIIGDLAGSLLVHKKLRCATTETGQTSYIGTISHWLGSRSRQWQLITALASLVLMLAYAGAQLVAGSKALHVLLGWPSWAGAVSGALIVALYCLAGGIRASIWTDAAQSLVMILAMGLLLVAAVNGAGGVSSVAAQMSMIDGFLDLSPPELLFPGAAGLLLFIVGWLFAGFSVIGQPHIMVRFMTIDNPDHIFRARIWYYLWFTAFYLMAMGVGMLSRIYISDSAHFDAELALPVMAQDLLHPAFASLILAGIFAATMSTADSLLLSCSATITHDIIPHNIEKTWLLRTVTLFITLSALVWALLNSQSVFNLVIMAWSGLGSTFAGLLIVLVLGARPTQPQMIAMSLVGLAVAVAWRMAGFQSLIYEGLPAILASLVLYLLWSPFTQGDD